jgi:hypothetical protein
MVAQAGVPFITRDFGVEPKHFFGGKKFQTPFPLKPPVLSRM